MGIPLNLVKALNEMEKLEVEKQRREDDTISRQDAIDSIMGEPTDAHYPLWYAHRIKLLPSAEPKVKYIAQIKFDRDDMEDLVNKKVNEIVDKMAKPKTGEWIVLDNCSNAGIYCSVCNNKIFDYTHKPKKKHSRYCPNCGARMFGDDEA